MKNKMLLIILFPVAVLLSGCVQSLKGPVFHAEEVTPIDKGLVYVYWTEYPGRKIAVDFSMEANGQFITNMEHGGYFVHEAENGPLEIKSSANFEMGVMGLLDVALTPSKRLELDIDAGEIYYVRCTLYGGAGHSTLYMAVVDDDKRGLYEVREARLLPKGSTKN